eukprot:scaffold25259_cov142-Isochrysis_galbana.AAC.3
MARASMAMAAGRATVCHGHRAGLSGSLPWRWRRGGARCRAALFWRMRMLDARHHACDHDQCPYALYPYAVIYHWDARLATAVSRE